MKRTLIVLSLLSLAAPLLGTSGAVPAIVAPSPADDVTRILDENGEVVWEMSVEPTNPELLKIVHYLRYSADAAKPGGGGSTGSNDCASTAYKLAGWHWTKPYSAYATSYASVFSTSANTWDAQTAVSLNGGISSGSRGTAGVQDFVNQIDFVRLSNTGTIAVTTTWAYRTTGEAVESDGQYNTYYTWATNGDPNSMDVQNIATHEIGHTFGLDHPTTSSTNSCLTMYAYGANGETQKRTLGTGDILGIQAIYGA